MPDALGSKSDDAIGSPDVIYIPDQPGLMKTGGLNRIAVTLPLELTPKITWSSIYALVWFSLAIALSAWMEWSMWQSYALYANPSEGLFPILGLSLMFFLARGAIVESLKEIANVVQHRGTALKLDGNGFEARRFNKTVCSVRWTDIEKAEVGTVWVNPALSYYSLNIEMTLSAPLPGKRYAYRIKAQRGPPFVPWPERLPANVVALPLNGLSMPPQTIRAIFNELLHRHGKSIEGPASRFWG